MHTNVGTLERVLSIGAGAALIAAAIRQSRGGGRLTKAATGLGLVARGIGGYCPVNAAVGRGRHATTKEALGGPRGIHIREAVTIDRPADTLYAMWRQLESLPDVMRHVSNVREIEPGLFRWTVVGPAGRHVSWDARLINDDGATLAWQSVPGSEVVTAGSVRFQPLERGTEVIVHLQYDPPRGRAAKWIATMFGQDPAVQVREDLREFKHRVEGRGHSRFRVAEAFG